MRSRLRAFAAAAALCVAMPSVAWAAADDSLLQYEAVLLNPNGIAANLAYAYSLSAAGQLEAARQVYLKVLALDPNNANAKAALAALALAGPTPAMVAPALPEGARTDYTLRVGGAYESNSPRRPPNFRSFDDTVGFGELTVNDTRQLGAVTLQSNFDIYSDFHNRYSPGDVSYVALDSGPVFDLGSNGKLRVAVGGEYVLQGQSPKPANGDHTRQFEFDSANVIFNWFPAAKTELQSVNLLVGYDNFRNSSSFRSGVVLRGTAPFVFDELVPATHTQVIVTPGFVYNGADQTMVTTLPLQPAHYSEINVDVMSLTPIAEHLLASDRLVGKLGLFADAQYYSTHDPVPTNDRQDIRLIPLAGLRLVGFIWPRVQLDLDYRYDRNFSNDFAQRFEDHIVSLIATVRF